MGTPDFAVPVLSALLLEEDFEIVAVITAVDRQGGRGRKQLIESPVKKLALQNGLEVFQPSNLKSKAFVKRIQELDPDLAVVVAFRMLPECIWSIPKFGTINLHASLLPAYRGAAPINWSIIRGDKITGLTTFLIAKEIDTGALIYQQSIEIAANDDAGSLHDKMLQIGPNLVIKSVKNLLEERVIFQKQDEAKVTLAPKLFKHNTQIDANLSAEEVHNFIRGLSPHPGAWTLLDGSILKVFKSAYTVHPHTHMPGRITSDGRRSLKIFCQDGFVELLELQLQGKKRMDIRSFLNGYNVSESSEVMLESS
ncbi:UNVERIFIED_CONTAM: hypothetical protein GTU68_028318 [Idotea baltica]|nr:hypothetical protein [Idotea baltica]